MDLKRQLYFYEEGHINVAAIMGYKNTSPISSYDHYIRLLRDENPQSKSISNPKNKG